MLTRDSHFGEWWKVDETVVVLSVGVHFMANTTYS